MTAARALLAGEHAVALVTLGAAGALVVTASEVVEVRAPATEVVDTIGAGDAFMGSFLANWHARGLGREGLAQLDQVAETVAFACRVAAITCSRAGAEPPRLAELELEPNAVGSVAESRLGGDRAASSGRPGGAYARSARQRWQLRNYARGRPVLRRRAETAIALDEETTTPAARGAWRSPSRSPGIATSALRGACRTHRTRQGLTSRSPTAPIKFTRAAGERSLSCAPHS